MEQNQLNLGFSFPPPVLLTLQSQKYPASDTELCNRNVKITLLAADGLWIPSKRRLHMNILVKTLLTSPPLSCDLPHLKVDSGAVFGATCL